MNWDGLAAFTNNDLFPGNFFNVNSPRGVLFTTPGPDRAGLQRQRDYFNQVRDAVSAAIREGKTRAEVLALEPREVADLGWPELLTHSLGVIYDELTAKR